MTIEELERDVTGYLAIKDFDALRLVLAAAASHGLPGDPVWLIIVGPPSSAKTEIINLLRFVRGTRHLSSLTPKTLASGFQGGQRGETSYLAKLTNAVLTIKDLTTILEMDRHARKEVLAQLREVYDGKFGAAWGTGKEFQWEGRVTLIAGVTPVIHKYWGVMASMGPRFLFIEPETPDRIAVASMALSMADHGDRREALAKKVADWFEELSAENPEVPEEQFEEIARIADFVTRARSAVERDSRSREVEFVAAPEMPARVAKQLHILARGLARIEGRSVTNGEDLRRLRRIGMDTVPPMRRGILRALGEGEKSIADLEQVTRVSEAVVRRAIEELVLLDLVEVGREAGKFRLASDWQGMCAGGMQGGGMNSAMEDQQKEANS